jgi:type VI secretion system protein ImpI
LSVTIQGQHGIDIGRDQYLDWTLPDPSRCISGKHCEVRFHDGAHWLHDVSTNGTYVNGSDRRMQGPHRLRHGDRVDIGHYVIRVEVDGEGAAPAPGLRAGPADPSEMWVPEGEAAPPADPRSFHPARSARPAGADPLDWFVDVPDPLAPAPFPAEPRRPEPPPEEDYTWAQAPTPRAPAPTTRIPGARRA